MEEALEVYGRLIGVTGQARAWQQLGQLLYGDKQFEAAEKAASKAVDLFSENSDQYGVYDCHCDLGNICHSRAEIEKAINHFETAIGIASSFGWADPQFRNHHYLAQPFFGECKFDDAPSRDQQTIQFGSCVGTTGLVLVLAMHVQGGKVRGFACY